MTVRNFLSLADVSPTELSDIVRRCLVLKKEPPDALLRHKTVGLYFRKTSTRTRTSFAVGAMKLGASVVTYSDGDLQTNTGETVEDTATVLSAYLDVLVVRTAGPIAEMNALANQRSMAVINAMSECEHPTQAIADLSTMLEHFGRLAGLHVAYLGEGNNTATALALAISRMADMRLTLLTPPGYGLPRACWDRVKDFSAESGALVEEHHDMRLAPSCADVVYATRWQTTGTSKADPNWRSTFRPFAVTANLMARIGKQGSARFMHDLPAVRGEDVAAEVIDGTQSIAFQQAANKLYGAMAILEWCVSR